VGQLNITGKETTINPLTTTFLFSKIVVYLRVQKSRGGASVVGAYICTHAQGEILRKNIWQLFQKY
jgi:hypothetical protein